MCIARLSYREDLKLPQTPLSPTLFPQYYGSLTVHRDIVPLALAKRDAVDAYAEVIRATTDAGMDVEFEQELEGMTNGGGRAGKGMDTNPRECIINVCEHDIP